MHLVEGIFALARSRLNQPFLRDGLRMAKLLLVVMAAVSVMAAGPAPQTFDERTVGGPASGAPAELYPVPGAGPFPARVLLHPCNGVGPHSRTWARRLAGWGYVLGGGALMTPLLILVFGMHPATAVGTDLLYASVYRSARPAVQRKSPTTNTADRSNRACFDCPTRLAACMPRSFT
jgi:hypothetical protein